MAGGNVWVTCIREFAERLPEETRCQRLFEHIPSCWLGFIQPVCEARRNIEWGIFQWNVHQVFRHKQAYSERALKRQTSSGAMFFVTSSCGSLNYSSEPSLTELRCVTFSCERWVMESSDSKWHCASPTNKIIATLLQLCLTFRVFCCLKWLRDS